MSDEAITLPLPSFDSVAYLKKGLMDEENMRLSCLYAGLTGGKSHIMKELYLEHFLELTKEK